MNGMLNIYHLRHSSQSLHNKFVQAANSRERTCFMHHMECNQTLLTLVLGYNKLMNLNKGSKRPSKIKAISQLHERFTIGLPLEHARTIHFSTISK